MTNENWIGEDHTPEFLFDCETCGGQGYIASTVHVYEPGCGFSHPDVEETPCQACNGNGWFVCEAPHSSAPDLYPPHNSGERLRSSDAAGSGADPQPSCLIPERLNPLLKIDALRAADEAACRLDGMFWDIFNNEERLDLIVTIIRAATTCALGLSAVPPANQGGPR
jgi:hypothetical protein